MRNSVVRFVFFTFLLLNFYAAGAQNSHSLSGYVRETDSGEAVIGAVVYSSDKRYGVSTDENGFYSLSLPDGEYSIICGCLEFLDEEIEIVLKNDIKHDFSLKRDKLQLEAATVKAQSKRDMLTIPQMGVQTINSTITKKLPALMGESDIIRVIQMMPGVSTPSEGSTGFSVRGGGVDQNLVLMDGAPIYNSGHFLGFISMFNSDVVKLAQLYKGDFPAKYGGKTASVLDVSTNDGNMNEFHGNLGIGLITSKVFLEGPIAKSKASFMLAARRTYLDLFFPLFRNRFSDKTKLSFYDVNAKVNWNISDKDRLSVSAFVSNDIFGLSMEELGMSLMDFDYTNSTQSVKWSHVFSPKVTSNLILYNSLYRSGVGTEMDQTSFDWESRIRESGIRYGYTWRIHPDHTMNFGLNAGYYRISPNETHPRPGSLVTEIISPYTYAVSPSLYAQMESKFGPLTVRYGLRGSTFTTMGETDQFYYDPLTHEKTQEKHFGSWEPIKTYGGVEPRVSALWSLDGNTSLKAAYSRSYQYIQQAVMSVSGSIADTWFTASPNVKPQISDQFTAGVTRDFCNDALQLTVELFYKNNKNTIDLKDNPGLVMINDDREGLLRFGKSYAYGAEVMLEYEISKFSGWVSYTYSKAMYDIPEINDGKPYRSPVNHEHAFNVVCNYDFTKRVSASADWVFYSGAPTTFPAAKYMYGGAFVPVYPGRNEDTMPDYHRLDLSLTVKGKKRVRGERWGGEWNFSVYNVYDRHNAWAVTTGYNRADKQMEARKVYIFSVLPSVSYNIAF